MQNGFAFLKKGVKAPNNILPVVINPHGGSSSSGGVSTSYETYASLASFPVTGDVNIFYIADDTEKVYRWTGAVYIEVSASGLADGDYGDVTVGGGGATITIDAGVVTNAKLATVPTLTIKGKNTAGTGAPLDLTVAQVKTMLGINGSIADVTYTQPSASTSWTLVHGRAIPPNFAFFNALGEREYPLEDHSVAGEVTLTFATSEVHTATLPGNGTSASIRNDSIVTLLASDINTALGVIDITGAKTIIIDMDTNITSNITFTGTPADYTPLRLAFVKGATAYTASLDTAKFKSTTTTPIPSPLLTVTPNTEDVFDFLLGSLSGKMALTGYVYGI
jgi:hypothetical protein